MNRTPLIKKINRVFPALTLVEKGEDYGWSKGSILVGAEDGTHLLDYWGCGEGCNMVNSKLTKVIEDAGWHLEWNDPGTCLLFDDRG
jgi:hypothetical protein